MSTLLLKLAAPLQAWGAESKFTRRTTRHEPTKSAVLGLIAAAQGRRRTDSIEDLLSLWFGVRIDQPGVILRDLQTAHRPNGDAMPLSDRYYLTDAVFVAGLAGERSILESLEQALIHPAFPLFLGRRSCVPSGKLVLGISDADLVPALRSHPWEASRWYRRRTHDRALLDIVRDVLPTDRGDETKETVQDNPLSFSQERRRFGWREVVHDDPVVIEPQQAKPRPHPTHDPMILLAGD